MWGRLTALCVIFLSVVSAGTGRAEIIDRIAVSVGNQVITEAQISLEIRVTAFLNQEPADLSTAGKKIAAERLIEQTLLKREMDVSHFPLPDMSAAEKSLAAVEAQYRTEAEFQQALQQYGLTKEDLKSRLWWQSAVLRFVDERFRPGVQIPNADIRQYYDQQVGKWQQEGVSPIPTLDESRDKIEEALTQQRVDNALDRWLGDARTQVEIRFHAGVLR